MSVVRKWKFLFVSAPFGGISVFFKNLQTIVEKRDDIEASWIWIEFPHDKLVDRISPMSLNWTIKGGLLARARVRELEKSGKRFDAVLFNHTIPATFLTKFSKRTPTILSLDVTPHVLEPYNMWYRGRDIESTGLLALIKTRLLQRVYDHAASILPWSELVRDSLVRHYGNNPKKVHVVPPGIELTQWAVPAGHTESSSQLHRAVNILFVGAEFHRKGGDLLLHIAHRTEFQNCEFHVVTKNLEVASEGNVVVHNRVLPNSGELQSLYQQADIFVLPTRADLSPNAVCEAMAFHLPVVSTMVGGIHEMVEEGKTGFLVAPDDEESFAARLTLLVQSPELRLVMGRAGREKVMEQYDIQKNSSIILEYMMNAASNQRGKQ